MKPSHRLCIGSTRLAAQRISEIWCSDVSNELPKVSNETTLSARICATETDLSRPSAKPRDSDATTIGKVEIATNAVANYRPV